MRPTDLLSDRDSISVYTEMLGYLVDSVQPIQKVLQLQHFSGVHRNPPPPPHPPLQEFHRYPSELT